MQLVLADSLPKAGIVQMIPQALVHGPFQYGGLNILDLYTKQLISQ